jgi:hypothetical protein
MRAPDPASEIARFFCETPVADLAGGAKPTGLHVIAELIAKFPSATEADFRRGYDIAQELLEVDRRVAAEMEAINTPRACGKPGWIVCVGDGGAPTGTSFCVDCGLIEAAKMPCLRCGGPMLGEDIRAGITLCEACDPDGIGWLDDGCSE